MPCAPAPETTPTSAATSEPFAFAPTDQYTAGARSMAMLMTIPMRAMMVVMGEAFGTHRAD
ncbi:MAG: hypothetical protein AAFR44_04765 [Pseudomonadota bacterium]